MIELSKLSIITSLLFLLINYQASQAQTPSNTSIATAKVVNTFPYTDANVNTSLGGSNTGMQGGCIAACCSTVVYRIEIPPYPGTLRGDMSSYQPLAGSMLGYISSVPNPTNNNQLTFLPRAGNFCGFRDTLQIGRTGNIYFQGGEVFYVMAFGYNNQTGQGVNTNFTFDYIPECPAGYVCQYPTIEICDNNGYVGPTGTLLNTSGVYTDTLVGTGGAADTIVQTTLTINNMALVQDTLKDETLCPATDTLRHTAYTEYVSYADFDKNNSDWVQINSVANDIAGTNRSAFMWIKQSTQVTGSSQQLLAINTSTGGNVCLMQIGTNEEFGVYDGSNSRYSGVVVTDGQWHYVGYTYDESSNLTKLYIDGVMVRSYVNAQSVAANHQISLGQEFDSGNSMGNFFEGQMTEVTIWNEVLDSADVAVLMDAPVMINHPKYTHLKAHYPMMVNCGDNRTQVVDYSGNNNNGIAAAASIQVLSNLEQISGFNAASYYSKEWSANGTPLSTAATLELTSFSMGTYELELERDYFSISDDWMVSMSSICCTNTTGSITEVVCGSYTSPSGQVYTTSGTYMDTIPNASNCDSILTLNLTVNSSTTGSITEVVCGSYTSPSGQVYATSGTYMDTIPNASNCDSILTLNLTVNSSTTGSITEVVCGSYTSPSGQVYTTSGTYMDTIPNANNCDSILTLNLTVNSSTTGSITEVVCGSYTSPSGQVYTTSGTYIDTIPNASNCDSILTINLTVNSSTTGSITEVVCGSYTSPSGQVYTTSGTYMDTIPNANNCDSILTLNLTVNSSTTGSITEVVCGSYTSPSGQVYTTSGTYIDTIPNASNCDSILTINLTVNSSTTGSITEVVCGSYTSPSGQVYTTSGTYMDTIPNASNCDSILTINLTVNSSTTGSITEVVCGSYTSPSGQVYTTSGTYMDTIPNASNCDSILTLNLTVNSSTTGSITEVVCGSYTSPSGQVYTTSGTYMDTIPNASNCDSILTINLTVSTIQLGVTQNGINLTADETGAIYQWLDCSNGMQAINGATSQTFIATSNGDYAVEITNADNCVDTSACINVTGLSISGTQTTDVFKLYPNPTTGNVILDLGGLEDAIWVNIYDLAGKQVFSQEFATASLFNVEIDALSGVYLLEVSTASGIKTTLKLTKL
ncbi:LamG-like jellyroll fold domain-containing protein [Aureispira anguillae]|uniref:T9SS type A sorting domain-containing protein n=1 Tax=Aureispira anguillae TaxID=2864201 RepID=A0A915YG54_9BACT|nr:LamG-like jellyroll fold domain-containing protein [Aureispira anguillae]BDS12542.1 T9SS type A sorting domain-containing protein [Aureispira anguillae]